MGKKQNRAGALLKRFVKGLESETSVECVQTEELERIVDFDIGKLEEFDVLIFKLDDTTNSSYLDGLVDAVGLQRKDYLAVLVLLETDEEMRRVITKLDY